MTKLPRINAFERASNVISTDLGSELILLDPGNSEMFSVNECGRTIWLSLPARSPAEIADLLCAEYDVEPARALTDA